MTPITKKHPQFVLAMDNTFFVRQGFEQGLMSMDYERFLSEGLQHLAIRERNWLDNVGPTGQGGDPTYRQLLPYTVIVTEQAGQRVFVPYQRTSKVGEERLAGKVSIGFGGHIDLTDVVTLDPLQGNSYDRNRASIIDLRATIERSSCQEIREEVLFSCPVVGAVDSGEFPVRATNYFIIFNDAVGQLHTGLLRYVFVPEGYTVQCAEEELLTMSPMSTDALLASDFTLEPWTRVILEQDRQFGILDGWRVAEDSPKANPDYVSQD